MFLPCLTFPERQRPPLCDRSDRYRAAKRMSGRCSGAGGTDSALLCGEGMLPSPSAWTRAARPDGSSRRQQTKNLSSALNSLRGERARGGHTIGIGSGGTTRPLPPVVPSAEHAHLARCCVLSGQGVVPGQHRGGTGTLTSPLLSFLFFFYLLFYFFIV